MATIARAMAVPDSGLDIRDRMWLKITIPNAFLGKLMLLTRFSMSSSSIDIHCLHVHPIVTFFYELNVCNI